MAAITASHWGISAKDWTSAMANGTAKPPLRLSTLVNLTGFGFAAAASMVFWGIASFSFLSEILPEKSRIQDDCCPAEPLNRVLVAPSISLLLTGRVGDVDLR
jgi:hypothetical protein